MMEKELFKVLQLFSYEINKMEGKLNGSALSLELTAAGRNRYDQSDTAPKVGLNATFFDGKNYQTIHGASLGSVMDEVYRRVGFTDREATKTAATEATLVGLPAPDGPMEMQHA